MATGNSVHDEVKEQQQKLKGKPFKEKWLISGNIIKSKR